MRFKIILIMLILLVLSANALAFESKDVFVPKEVNVFNSPKTIEITIDNLSNEDKTLSVEFIAPTKALFQFIDKPAIIKAEERITMKLKLIPNAYLSNSSYNTTMIVSLNNDKVMKKIKLNFIPEPEIKEEKTTDNSRAINDLERTATGYIAFAFTESDMSLFNKWLLTIVLLLFVLLIVRFYDKKYKKNIEEKTRKWRQ